MPWIILSLQQARRFILAVFLPMSPVLAAHAEVVELRTALVEKSGGIGVEYFSGDKLVGRSTPAAPAGVEILLPGAKATPVEFRSKTARNGVIELGPAQQGALTLRLRLEQKTPSLVERTLEVTAKVAQRFSLTFPFDAALDGEFASFSGPEKTRTLCDTVRVSARTETFPVAMLRTSAQAMDTRTATSSIRGTPVTGGCAAKSANVSVKRSSTRSGRLLMRALGSSARTGR